MNSNSFWAWYAVLCGAFLAGAGIAIVWWRWARPLQKLLATAEQDRQSATTDRYMINVCLGNAEHRIIDLAGELEIERRALAQATEALGHVQIERSDLDRTKETLTQQKQLLIEQLADAESHLMSSRDELEGLMLDMQSLYGKWLEMRATTIGRAGAIRDLGNIITSRLTYPEETA